MVPYTSAFNRFVDYRDCTSCPSVTMESAFLTPISKVLGHFQVDEHAGLTDKQVTELRNKHGRNCA